MTRIVLVAFYLFPALTAAQTTTCLSLAPTGYASNGSSQVGAAPTSADGRFVAFASSASDLVLGDTNGANDIFVRDRLTNAIERVSVSSAGAQSNNNSFSPALSADGRYVAFASSANNLAAGDTNGVTDVFWHDRQTHITGVASAAIDVVGLMYGNGPSHQPAISADGRYIAFSTSADLWADPDTNGRPDIYVKDRLSVSPRRVSVGHGGAETDGNSDRPALSADGRYVVFESTATNLVSGDTNLTVDVFRRDRSTGTTALVSIRHPSIGTGPGNGQCFSPSVSDDGQLVAFESFASNLVLDDTNLATDVFVRDMAGSTSRVSVSSTGAQAGTNCMWPRISRNGRYVAFVSLAANLVPGDTNMSQDVFVHDRVVATTTIESRTSVGALGGYHSAYPDLSGDGALVTFASAATNLVPNVLSRGQLYARTWRVPASFTTYGAGCSGSGLGGSNVVPASLRTTFGIGWHTYTLSSAPGRYQQVFLGSELPQALRLAGVSFRRSLAGGSYPGGTVDLEIRLGYTTFDYTNLTATFANNFNAGAPITVMPRRTFVLPNMLPTPPTDPSRFEIDLPFTVPFDWQPQPGRNLLIEIIKRTSVAFPYRIDAGSGELLTRAVFASPDTAATGTAVTGGAAMCFRVASAPLLGNVGLPILGRSYATTLTLARPNTVALLQVGVSDQRWQGLPLPLSLAALGAPGCSLLVSPDVMLPVTVDTQGQGAFQWPATHALSMMGGVLFQQYAVLDPAANALGLSYTQGGRAQVGNQ